MPSVTISIRVSRDILRSEPHRVSDRRSDRFAQCLRHARCRGAGGEASRLEHDDSPVPQPSRIFDGKRYARGFAGSGFRDDYRVARRGKFCLNFRQHIIDGKAFHARSNRSSVRLSSMPFRLCGLASASMERPLLPHCTKMTTRTIPTELFDIGVFGATGDLAQRKLLPALFRRDLAGQVPEGSRIVGISRRKMSDDEFRTFARKAIEENTAEDERKPDVMKRFLARLSYVTLDVSAGQRLEGDRQGAQFRQRPRSGLLPRDRARSFRPDLRQARRQQAGYPEDSRRHRKADRPRPRSARAVNDAIGKAFPENRRSSASITISARRRCRT